MATVNFGSVGADMRLEADWYGIPQLQSLDAFLQAFVPVSTQVFTSTPTLVVVREVNAASEVVTVSFAGNIEAGVLNALTIEAKGILLTIGGNFVIDEFGNLSGTANLSSARFAASGALIERESGISVPISTLDLVDLDDPNVYSGADIIIGGGGSDYLLGYAGSDTMSGGLGDDTLDGGSGTESDALDGGGGLDTATYASAGAGVVVNLSTVLASGGAGADTLLSIENLTGSAFGDLLTGSSGNNVMEGLRGGDTMDGGAGLDTVSYAGAAGAVAVNLSTGRAAGGSGADTLSSFESILGSSFNDQLIGNALGNTFDGGPGADTLVGGAGNDTYLVDNAEDVATEALNGGTDVVSSSVSYTLGDNVESLILLGTAPLNGTGNPLNNTINGNAGNNELDGAAGIDTLIGGSGDDVYLVDEAFDAVLENALAGNDTVRSPVTFSLGDNLENLELLGTSAINGTGNGLNNRVTGNAGNNILDGGAGADQLVGGAGDDTFAVNNAGDAAVEIANEGLDTVRSNINYLLGPNVENLVLAGAASIDGSGNALNNIITGNAAPNQLAGGGGNDLLDGAGGLDRMKGGPGNDTYVVDATMPATVLSVDGEPGDFISGGQHFFFTPETGSFSVNFMLDLTGDGQVDGIGFIYRESDLTHIFALQFGTNRLGLNLAPGAYPNARDSSPGHPHLDVSGEARSAIAVFGSFSIQEVAIDYSGVTPVLLRFSATFEQHADSPTAPAMFGAIRFNATATVGETVIEEPGEGFDRVLSSVPFVLPANVEHLTLTGSDAINGGGNGLDNLILGNAANNVIDGRAGNDTMNGGSGVDTVSYSTAAAAVSVDLSLTTAQNTLGAGTDRLVGFENLVGSRFADTLTGNGGNNFLNGGLGADILRGRAGNDTLVFDAADLEVNGGPGTDTLTISGSVGTVNLAASAGVKLIDLEQINLRGTGNNTLTLTAADVLKLSTTSDRLVVLGNAGDVVDAGAGWIQGENQTLGGQIYATYTQGLATLLVDVDMARSITA